jgi:glutamate-5-semialdehyde dehydrogenase
MTLNPDNFETLSDYMQAVGNDARAASKQLATTKSSVKSDALKSLATEIRQNAADILSANVEDVADAVKRGLSPAMIDRLTLDNARIDSMACSVESIAGQGDPLGVVLDQWTQPNGLHFSKVSVPIGVIGMIYESRPNVTADAAALCLQSGNAVILRGGSEAVRSNMAIFKAVQTALRNAGLPESVVHLIGTQDRDAVGHMLAGLSGTIDLIIPRGGKGLVARVQSDARVPVLAHLDGLNHSYVHRDADLTMAKNIVLNAKMRRTGVCGATETILVDRDIASTFVPSLVQDLAELGCEIRGDAESQGFAPQITQATPQDFQTEHLAPIANLAIVADLDAALAHIAGHGSGHTEAIITNNDDVATRFLSEVDSAIVLHNASTQFADGGEFGFGAEIGIATGRLHARGPVGAKHLTSYKYQVVGAGTVRP